MILPCVILAIDPGKQSGAALYVNGTLVSSSTCDVSTECVERAAKAALAVAREANVPLVLVGETWGRGGPLGMAQWGALHAAWQRWLWAVDNQWKADKAEHGERHNYKPKTVKIHVSTWRSDIYGGKRLEKGTYKAAAVAEVLKRFGIELEAAEHDRAEAILIGWHATTSQAVRDVVPKRLLKGMLA